MRNILRHTSDPYYPLMFGVLLVLWGVWLLIPGSAYAASQGFNYVAQLLPEAILGTIAVSLGAIQVSSVFFKLSAMVGRMGHISFYFWLFILVSYIKGDWHTPGVIVYFWLAFMNGIGYINWKLNQQEVDPLD